MTKSVSRQLRRFMFDHPGRFYVPAKTTEDKLGSRIVADRAEIALKRLQASNLERDAQRLRRQADEIERLLDMARMGPLPSSRRCDCVSPADAEWAFCRCDRAAHPPS